MLLRGMSPRDLAIDLLARSPCRVKMAAVLSDARGIFAWGWNHPYVHAEEHALMRANPSRLARATLTLAGIRRGRRVHAYPCAMRCLPLVQDKVRRFDCLGKDGVWRRYSGLDTGIRPE